MKPTKQMRAEVSGYIQKWQPRLYLHEWSFKTTHFHSADEEDKSSAAIIMKTEYKQANIKINPRFWEDTDPKEREMIIVHELCHCIVQPLVQIAADAANGHGVSGREIDHWKESVTQHLTNSIFYGLK